MGGWGGGELRGRGGRGGLGLFLRETRQQQHHRRPYPPPSRHRATSPPARFPSASRAVLPLPPESPHVPIPATTPPSSPRNTPSPRAPGAAPSPTYLRPARRDSDRFPAWCSHPSRPES